MPRRLCAVLVTPLLILFANVSSANNEPAQEFKPLSKSLKNQATEAKQKHLAEFGAVAGAQPKVDINNAGINELKTLPGVSHPIAVKIIANRPYGSKAWLVTKSIVGPAVFEGINKRIFAGQPSKQDAAKNPEVFGVTQ
jgi:DNA uptake protein ComE-like DNA-binding protein